MADFPDIQWYPKQLSLAKQNKTKQGHLIKTDPPERPMHLCW